MGLRGMQESSQNYKTSHEAATSLITRARGNAMSVKRVEQIIAYGEAMIRCYETQLSEAEKLCFHTWESSDEFTRTDDWPGWAKYIGLRPGAKPELELVRRSA